MGFCCGGALPSQELTPLPPLHGSRLLPPTQAALLARGRIRRQAKLFYSPLTTPLPTLQAALLARGRTVRQAKLFFYAKMAEKALASYERDGWGEFPTQVRRGGLRFAAVVDGLGCKEQGRGGAGERATADPGWGELPTQVGTRTAGAEQSGVGWEGRGYNRRRRLLLARRAAADALPLPPPPCTDQPRTA